MNNDLIIKSNIGSVPSDWKKVKMSTIITEVINDASDENIPLYSLTINEGLIVKPERYEREFLVKDVKENYKVINKDEFALNPMNLRFGALSKMRDNNPARVSKYYNIFKCSDMVDSDFLETFLKSERVLNYYNRMATGTLEEKKRVHFSQLLNFEFYLPSLSEQKKISSILSTWDLAIEKQEQLIEKKTEYKKGLMQKLLSGEVRFKEFINDWNKTKLELVSTITKGVQFNKNDMNESGEFAVINGGIVPSGYSDKWNREADTITISEGGNSCGYVNYIREKFWSGGHCYTIEPLNNSVDKVFLYYLLKNKESYIMSLRVGSGLPNIQKSSISGLQIKIPDIEEQKKIAQVLSIVDKEIELYEKELDALKLQKKGLIQRLLSGEVRVKVD